METTYRPEFRPSACDVREAFVDEIRSLGGQMIAEWEVGGFYIGRSVLPPDAEVLPGDVIKGGVAVRVSDTAILIHPYTFRLVCENGAIAAHALGTRRIERIECTDVFEPAYESARALAQVADAVRECASTEAFTNVANEMRTVAESDADEMLSLLSMLPDLFTAFAERDIARILHRFYAGSDPSPFAWLNAITSVARDTVDANARWQLETLGGEYMAAVTRALSRNSVGAPAERLESARLAG